MHAADQNHFGNQRVEINFLLQKLKPENSDYNTQAGEQSLEYFVIMKSIDSYLCIVPKRALPL